MRVSGAFSDCSLAWDGPALATDSQPPRDAAIITPLFTDGETEAPPRSPTVMGWLGPSPQGPFPPQISQLAVRHGQGTWGSRRPSWLPPMPRAEVPALWAHSALRTPFRSTRVLECTGGGRRGGQRRLQRPLPASLQGPELPPASPLCEVAGRGPLPGPPASSGERPESPVHPQQRLAGPSTSEMQIRP